MVKVEVIYIPAVGLPVHVSLYLDAGATVADAIHQSGLQDTHPETQDMAVGIFAKQVSRDMVVEAGDRIEIYRPLQIDPKENRRQKARQGRVK